MRFELSEDGTTTNVLDKDDLVLIINALNEVCNGVTDLNDDEEFATRLGTTRPLARYTLASLTAALDDGRQVASGERRPWS